MKSKRVYKLSKFTWNDAWEITSFSSWKLVHAIVQFYTARVGPPPATVGYPIGIYIYIKIFHEWLNDQKPRRLSTPPFFNIPGMDARKDYLKISKLLRDNTTISKFSQILILWSYELINLIIFFNSAVWSTIRVWTTMITP